RVPGFNSANRRERNARLTRGSKYMVRTVASLIRVSNRLRWENCARSATPASLAYAVLSFTRCGSRSTPNPRAPNFFAAGMRMRPSPEPRSTKKSFGPTPAMRSIASTVAWLVGTNGTSRLPGYLVSCAAAGSASAHASIGNHRSDPLDTMLAPESILKVSAARPGRGASAPDRALRCTREGYEDRRPGAPY